MSQQETRFPRRDYRHAEALAEQPVFLSGMRVLFDEVVGLYPVILETERHEGPGRSPRGG